MGVNRKAQKPESVSKGKCEKYYGINVELLAGFSGFTAFPMDGPYLLSTIQISVCLCVCHAEELTCAVEMALAFLY